MVIFRTSLLFFCLVCCCHLVVAQDRVLHGTVSSQGEVVPFALVILEDTSYKAQANSEGFYQIFNAPPGTYFMRISATGFDQFRQKVVVTMESHQHMNFAIQPIATQMQEVVVSGKLKEVSKVDSPIAIEVYTSDYFKANPSATLFEGLQQVNGVRPQVNCNVCNTGDIHINGLEGPYTMILIDGMPIVSGLSTVYGLSGIPQGMIDRIEVIKGPASTLYGSEAVGGVINVITKSAEKSPTISLDVFATTWAEMNADLATKFKVGKRATSLLGLNYFNYSLPKDNNEDGFTDVTLQDRFSVFNKWNFQRKNQREFSVAGRYVYEDRWGGQMNYKPEHRGGDSVYGESIYTSRWEVFGTYQLPLKERVRLQVSANGHRQNSVYGTMNYQGNQHILFGQMLWDKSIGRFDLLAGATYRFTSYDDNTSATDQSINGVFVNSPSKIHLPGAFFQGEWAINEQHKMLLGGRYDYNSIHGSIVTPRINYKWNSRSKKTVARLSAGNGYRVANVFTEDHAALTGSRILEFANELKPEKSWNANVNITQLARFNNGGMISFDASAFYTYFTNRIIADYESDANKIIYDNLVGHAISKGLTLNVDIAFPFGLKGRVGATLMDVYKVEEGERSQQLFTERFTGIWNLGYHFKKWNLTIDYTGNVYSPMRLPLLGELDPRAEFSSWWSIQNIQITKGFKKGIEIYGGVKNLLNWTPNKGIPFLIARAFDPFDKQVSFDANGQAMATSDNPHALTFDPAYVYGPNQGIRMFLGIRLTIN